jgi:hypothetical protein
VFQAWLAQNRLVDFTSKDVKRFLTEKGRSADSHSYLLTKAKEAGVVRHVGKGTKSRWIVTAAQKLLPAPNGHGKAASRKAG